MLKNRNWNRKGIRYYNMEHNREHNENRNRKRNNNRKERFRLKNGKEP